jgi:hypothetical protein
MPKIDWCVLDKAAIHLAEQWEKTPKNAKDLLHAFQQEKHRRDGGLVDNCPMLPEVEEVYSRWMACFGLSHSITATKLLGEILRGKKRDKSKRHGGE